MTENSPAAQVIFRWSVILTVVMVFLLAKLLVVELDYWGTAPTRQDTDFVNVYAAGMLAGPEAYDWRIHHKAEVTALGHDLPGYYGWHYPPVFLLVATGLAALPYVYAWLVWVVATGALYLITIRRLFGRAGGYFVAAAWPPAVWNVYLGQNGFLTTGLLGGAVWWLEQRPRLAGIMVGLLIYKPQFGLIFPLVLILERRWVTVWWAMAVSSLMIVLSACVFGLDSWRAFFEWMPITSAEVFASGNADLAKMHSLIGVLRWAGVDLAWAWAAQAVLALVAALGAVRLRRRTNSPELRAAALSVAALLASPYIYIYDLVALAVPLVLLLRVMARGTITARELCCLIAIVGAMLVFPLVKYPLGLVAMGLVAALVIGRIRFGGELNG